MNEELTTKVYRMFQNETKIPNLYKKLDQAIRNIPDYF